MHAEAVSRCEWIRLNQLSVFNISTTKTARAAVSSPILDRGGGGQGQPVPRTDALAGGK